MRIRVRINPVHQQSWIEQLSFLRSRNDPAMIIEHEPDSTEWLIDVDVDSITRLYYVYHTNWIISRILNRVSHLANEANVLSNEQYAELLEQRGRYIFSSDYGRLLSVDTELVSVVGA